MFLLHQLKYILSRRNKTSAAAEILICCAVSLLFFVCCSPSNYFFSLLRPPWTHLRTAERLADRRCSHMSTVLLNTCRHKCHMSAEEMLLFNCRPTNNINNTNNIAKATSFARFGLTVMSGRLASSKQQAGAYLVGALFILFILFTLIDYHF